MRSMTSDCCSFNMKRLDKVVAKIKRCIFLPHSVDLQRMARCSSEPAQRFTVTIQVMYKYLKLPAKSVTCLNIFNVKKRVPYALTAAITEQQ